MAKDDLAEDTTRDTESTIRKAIEDEHQPSLWKRYVPSRVRLRATLPGRAKLFRENGSAERRSVRRKVEATGSDVT